MSDARETTIGSRIIVSVLGHDRVGIIAAVTNILAESNINILDISQTIIQEFFTMMLIADLGNSKIDLAELKAKLAKTGEELGLRIEAQHEDIFRYMHRI
ncbi:MAG: ACT domain-containing protein [Dethiobacter sp.]|jgi:ACT domain-containing protein|nr:ACT domain-containing protein [Dethiobacter sp.]MBS3990131.1 ACT domain-containing protein [Dethiobacter sp.]